jgi:hypothetical protein
MELCKVCGRDIVFDGSLWLTSYSNDYACDGGDEHSPYDFEPMDMSGGSGGDER